MNAAIQKYRVAVSFILAGGFLWLAEPTVASILLGIPWILFGESLRTWASGCIQKNNELATHGPYAYTRNPLYLGSFLMGLGFSVMTGRWWVGILFLIAFYGIYRSTIRMEERGLRAKFGSRFEDYEATVPCFFPYRFATVSPSASASGFDWGLVKKHREYQAWLGIGLGILFMILKMGIRGG
ncbi:MAG: isoprenylcysteine carboxylmethyltransferase family protein [Nitrospirae bacterium]|nr:isoprenylcysteine carboxylmethyltransferase family protein [Nitrospirota bacterium]